MSRPDFPKPYTPFTPKQQFTRRMEWQALNEPWEPITDGEFKNLCLLAVRYRNQLLPETVRLAQDHLEVLNAKAETT